MSTKRKIQKRMSVVKAADEMTFNKALIAAIRALPLLYDFRLPEYSSKTDQQIAWEALSEEFGETVQSIKDRWKNLRAALTRHIRLEVIAEKTGEPQLTKSYYMFEEMKFLIPFTRVAKTKDLRHQLLPLRATECSEHEETEQTLQIFDGVDFYEEEQEEENNEDGEGQTYEEVSLQSVKENDATIEKGKEFHSLPKRIKLAEPIEQEIEQEIPSGSIQQATSTEEQMPTSDISPATQKYEDTPEWNFFRSLMPDILVMTPAQKRRMRLRFTVTNKKVEYLLFLGSFNWFLKQSIKYSVADRRPVNRNELKLL